MLKFWTNVRTELEYQDISQKELATAINESYNTLQSWMKNDRLPDAEQSVKIAQVLGTSVEFLVTGEDKKIRQKNERIVNLLKQVINDLQK